MIDELSPEALRFTPPDLSAETLLPFLADAWGVRGELRPLAGERDQNFRVRTADREEFVLKIASPAEDPILVDFQVQALLHVATRDRGLPVPRMILSRSGLAVEQLQQAEGSYAVRLLSYVPGVPMGTLPEPAPATIRGLGRLQARLCRALAGFTHPAESHFMPWDTLNGLVVSDTLRAAYLPETLREPCEPILDELASHALPAMRALPAQVIHNDAHMGNVMCDPDDPETITGVIDFGDLVKRPLVVDISTSLASVVEGRISAVEGARCLLTGFDEVLPLPAEQRVLLYDALLARLILTVQLLTFRVVHTEHSESLRTVDLADSIVGLRRTLDTTRKEFEAAIKLRP